MKAAIYCRVSTDNQESEGTSLQTQLEACLKHCQGKGHDVAYRFSEAYSGLTIDRPKLNELRELVRAGDIDMIVVYCLDRLSRDPTHGVMLTQELERHNVTLEAVTETVDSSELGKLINYIRGFASKLEAEKIRERTMRGKKAKAIEGKIPGGGYFRLYGFDYIPVSNKGGGKRLINESEAKLVQQIFNWYVNDRMSIGAIVDRLRSLNVATKYGGLWGRRTVLNMLKNPSYTGKTYAFTTIGNKSYSKPESDWIEIPDATPAIVSPELFEAAQVQLRLNKQKASRNAKNQYLLSSHIRCRKCGHSYFGCYTMDRISGQRQKVRRYRCSGWLKHVNPYHRCHNKSWQGDKLEGAVWEQIERILSKPKLILSEIEKQRQTTNQLAVLGAELHQIERQLKALDRDQEDLLQWALKGFPEETIITENNKINAKRGNLKAQKSELEKRIANGQEAEISFFKAEQFLDLVREKVKTLDYEMKRLALEMLDITVWIDGKDIEITGILPVADAIVSKCS